mmetsp:Transcript_35739/g.54968  ORF Transcript_35739/g.54968 Transcript_35739/m.54968 type:complete len:107 (-) Transcript_35739:277-597(-)
MPSFMHTCKLVPSWTRLAPAFPRCSSLTVLLCFLVMIEIFVQLKEVKMSRKRRHGNCRHGGGNQIGNGRNGLERTFFVCRPEERDGRSGFERAFFLPRAEKGTTCF